MKFKKNKDKKLKTSYLYIFKRIIYYLLFFLFVFGSLNGLLNYKSNSINTIPSEVDGFIREYVSELVNKTTDSKQQDKRKEYLNNHSINFKDIFTDDLKESRLVDLQIKNKNISKKDEKNKLQLYEYVLLLEQNTTGKDGQIENTKYGIKAQIVNDTLKKYYLVSMITPYDYTINTNVNNEDKKKIEDSELLKKEINGTPLDQNEQEVIKNQLKTFFTTYNEHPSKAQALVGGEVNLAILNGHFNKQTLEILSSATNKTKDINTLITEIKYKQNNKVEYTKKYFIQIKEKTIVKMEEI